MSRKVMEKQLDGIMDILTNYAAIAMGIGVFQHSWTGFVSAGISLLCVLYVGYLYRD